MNNAILMSSSADNIDFMIHGIFSYEILVRRSDYHITRLHTHCHIAVGRFSIAANRAMKHAQEVPRIPKRSGDDCRDAR